MHSRSALEQADAIRSGQLSAVELAHETIERMNKVLPDLNALAHRDDEQFLADAETADRERAHGSPDSLGPFHGVPLPIKDLADAAGWPTRYGSNASRTTPVTQNSLVVDRLRSGGFVVAGKSTTPEFGTISYTESECTGITRNPWNTDHTPGGSSGGAAAAVASGMVSIAHASDGGGSIRIPASCCGLIGLKASRHRIPNGIETFHGGSTQGVLTRTVADLAAALDLVARPDRLAWNNAPAPDRSWSMIAATAPGRLRIARTTVSPLGGVAASEPCAAVDRAADLLVAAGHDLVDLDFVWPDAGDSLNAFLTMWATGTVGLPLEDRDRIQAFNQPSAGRSADDYVAAVQTAQRVTRELASQFENRIDLLLTPTMAVEPPLVGSWRTGVDETPELALMNCAPMAEFTSLFNLTGLPAISLPVHIAASGLPVGAQLVAGPWRDDVLLQVAAQLEPMALWHEHHPPIWVQ